MSKRASAEDYAEGRRTRRQSRLEGVLVEHFHELWEMLCDRRGQFVSVHIKKSGEDWYTAVAKAEGEEGIALVVFGSGGTPADALAALDVSIKGRRWRPDRPWGGNGHGTSLPLPGGVKDPQEEAWQSRVV